MNICACTGPIGDCPCLRRERGQKIEITEDHISHRLFSLLSDDDKNTINTIKRKALDMYLMSKKSGEKP